MNQYTQSENRLYGVQSINSKRRESEPRQPQQLGKIYMHDMRKEYPSTKQRYQMKDGKKADIY